MQKNKSIAKIICLTLIFLVIRVPVSYAEFEYQKWYKKVELTNFGREVELEIDMEVNLPKNYYYKDWTYIFDKEKDISIRNVFVDNKEAKYKFTNNKLTINFPKVKDKEKVNLVINYIGNKKFHPFLRQEYVSLPKWSRGASGSLVVKYPMDMVIYSNHPKLNIVEYNRTLSWSGVIPNEGFDELFKLTLDNGYWNVENSTILKSNYNIKKITFTVPVSFKEGSYIVEKIKADIYPKNVSSIERKDKSYIMKYNNANSDRIYFTSKATIRNGVNFSKRIDIDKASYLDVSEDDLFLKGVMQEIYNSEFYERDIPLYRVISRWVNNHIKYDINQLGKNLSVEDIFKYRIGVCSHYSKIYVALCRFNGIPAVEVGGVAFDVENEQFMRHSWALVNYQGEWIPIDPTWNIDSGILPVSHIFFNFGDCNKASYSISNFSKKNGSIEMEWDFDVKWKGNSLNNY